MCFKLFSIAGLGLSRQAFTEPVCRLCTLVASKRRHWAFESWCLFHFPLHLWHGYGCLHHGLENGLGRRLKNYNDAFHIVLETSLLFLQSMARTTDGMRIVTVLEMVGWLAWDGCIAHRCYGITVDFESVFLLLVG